MVKSILLFKNNALLCVNFLYTHYVYFFNTLALDFKIEPRLFPFLDELDRIVMDFGGRVYLTKDVRMSKEVFRKGYPGWELFAEIREKYNMKGTFESLQSKRLEV